MANHEITTWPTLWKKPRQVPLPKLERKASQALALLHAEVVAAHSAQVPCTDDPAPWMDDVTPEVRQVAVEACQRRPALDACEAYAVTAGERWGVWGDIDRTPLNLTRNRPRAGRSPKVAQQNCSEAPPAAGSPRAVKHAASDVYLTIL